MKIFETEKISDNIEQQRKNPFIKDIIESFIQKESINGDLKILGQTLLWIKNSILKTGLEESLNKRETDNKTYHCFLNIVKFIDSYKLDDLRKLTNFYRKMYIESESKLLHLNKTKRKQIKFLKETSEFLLRDIESLKKRIEDTSLIFIKENALKNPIDQKHVQDMYLFLSEFPSRINYIEDFFKKIYYLGGQETKDQLDKYKTMVRYL